MDINGISNISNINSARGIQSAKFETTAKPVPAEVENKPIEDYIYHIEF